MITNLSILIYNRDPSNFAELLVFWIFQRKHFFNHIILIQ